MDCPTENILSDLLRDFHVLVGVNDEGIVSLVHIAEALVELAVVLDFTVEHGHLEHEDRAGG